MEQFGKPADPGDDAFWATALRQQIFLAGAAFAQRMQEKAEPLRPMVCTLTPGQT